MQGIERIKTLASEIKDKALLKIIEYLVSRDDMNEKYLNEEKSLKQMVQFIKGQAQKQANNGIAMIEDEVVYGWAIHYFDEPNEKLELKITTLNNKIVENKAEPIKIDKNKSKDTKWVAEGQLTLF